MVNEDPTGVEQLRKAVRATGLLPLVEALFRDETGDWRLVVVVPDLSRISLRTVYQGVSTVLDRSGGQFWLAERLTLLGEDDPGAAALLRLPVEKGSPGPMDLTLPLLPGFRGSILGGTGSRLRMSSKQLASDVRLRLDGLGLVVENDPRLSTGWRADFSVEMGHSNRILVEVVTTDRRSVGSRLRDAAGMANIAGFPVVLVYRTREGGDKSLDSSYGLVPVLTVDWDNDGPGRLDQALDEASVWNRRHRSSI